MITKSDAMKAAVEIAKARASSSPTANVAGAIEDAYNKIIELARRDDFLTNNG